MSENQKEKRDKLEEFYGSVGIFLMIVTIIFQGIRLYNIPEPKEITIKVRDGDYADQYFKEFVLDCAKYLSPKEFNIAMERIEDVESVKYYYIKNDKGNDKRLAYASFRKDENDSIIRYQVTMLNNLNRFKTALYHEWAHVALGYDHVEDSTAIMYYQNLNGCFSKQNWDVLVEELFTNRPKIRRYGNKFKQ